MLNLIGLLAAFDNLTPMNMDALLPALNFLWQGLLAIFVVIGLIIIAVKITAFAIAKCDEIKKRREEAAQDAENGQTNS
ncbi:MAG: hypothetical protein IJW60_06345 [Clostridia bacterium]|nr:hypothetical protein [Clostridia bacterium]